MANRKLFSTSRRSTNCRRQCGIHVGNAVTQRATLALLLLLALPLAGQSRYEEQIEIRLVQLDVVVTDDSGRRIHGLTVDDFDLFEGRKRQVISNFAAYRRSTLEEDSLEGAPETTAREPHTLLVVLDDLPRTAFVRSKALSSIQDLLTSVIRDGDRVGLVLWEPGSQRVRALSDPTRDLTFLSSEIRKLTNFNYTPDPASPDGGQVDGQSTSGKPTGYEGTHGADEANSEEFVSGETHLFRLRRKTAAMRQLVGSIGGYPGKKSILYVAHSFALPKGMSARLSAVAALEELAKAANAANVTFYAAKPGVAPENLPLELDRHLDALSRLTKPTGGLLEVGLPAVDVLRTAIMEDRNEYYSLAYRAKSDGSDVERRIRVTSRDPRYHVRVRDSVVQKSNGTMAREVLLARLFSDDDRSDLEFAIELGARRGAPQGRWLLPLVLKIPVEHLRFDQEGADLVARVKILIVAGNGLDEVTRVTENALRVVSGKHTQGNIVKYSAEILGDRRGSVISIGVFDIRTGKLGVRTVDNRSTFRRKQEATVQRR